MEAGGTGDTGRATALRVQAVLLERRAEARDPGLVHSPPIAIRVVGSAAMQDAAIVPQRDGILGSELPHCNVQWDENAAASNAAACNTHTQPIS